ncbi:1-deoxy-D-xylulose-5-phosphate synthase [bacterium]|nr:1-deoxy-D-xylulose-5-phosphate synthase [bacterium]
MSDFFEKINFPSDLRKMNKEDLPVLAQEVRDFLIDYKSKESGTGHFGAGLGVVELTIAIHYVFDTPKDKLVWDVGHQAYPHKILTGRKNIFNTNRKYGGLAGFPKISESEYDTFGVGHASTSISAGLGFACGMALNGVNNNTIAVIGDGAMTGGIAFEGLNNAGALNKKLIVVLNDNKMSISPNVGAINNYLTSVMATSTYKRLKDGIWEVAGSIKPIGRQLQKIAGRIEEGLKGLVSPGVLFERLGFNYFGPIDGHDVIHLVDVLEHLKTLEGPILLHTLTVKGKGFKFAEDDAVKWHATGDFDKETGLPLKKSKGTSYPKYQDVFGETMAELGEKNKKIVAVTAAMLEGTGLAPFADKFPERFFDVGIAEQHAVTFCGSLAIEGLVPVCAIYSSFLQRAFDQLIHDIALQNLNVVFAMDRSGLVGEDGPTHHGSFDLSYLRLIPNFVVLAPKDQDEMRGMLKFATEYKKGPVAIRYPRGNALDLPKAGFMNIEFGKSEKLREGKNIVIIGVGTTVNWCLEAAAELEKEGIFCEVINLRFVKPIDREMLLEVAAKFDKMLTVEENTLVGGAGSAILEFYQENKIKHLDIVRLGIPDKFIEHGSPKELYEEIGLTPSNIRAQVRKLLNLPATNKNLAESFK